eukprot:gene12197-14128_t
MCPNLVNYDLGAEVVELRDMPPTLESLCVDQCTSVRIVNLNTNLRKLKICSLEGDDSDVVGMFTSCLHLQELDLSYNGFLTDVTLTRIADSYRGTLTDLNIGGWEGVSCAAIKYLCEKCTGLTSFRIGGISDEFDPNSIIVALDHCPSLRTLDISCSTITDEVLVRIAAAPLEYINILAIRGFTDEELGSNSKSFNPACILAALDTCPTLCALDIGQSAVTDEVMARIAAAPLECLRMRGIQGITEKGIMALVNGCFALQKISINHELFNPLVQLMWQKMRPDLKFLQ